MKSLTASTAAWVVAASLTLASWAAAAECERCMVEVPKGQKLCAACKTTARALEVAKTDEPALVQDASQARDLYEESLEKLIEYYVGIGHASKIARAREELKLLRRVPRHRFIVVADMVGQSTASRPIPEADKLYQDARTHQERMALLGWKRKHLDEALDRYRYLLRKYPDSDKAGLAVFQMGEIYASFTLHDFARAARCYEKCYEWSPYTTLPARYKAAVIYDKKLHKPQKAIEIYALAAEYEAKAYHRREAADRLKSLQKAKE